MSVLAEFSRSEIDPGGLLNGDGRQRPFSVATTFLTLVYVEGGGWFL